MQTPPWQQALKSAFTDLHELLAFLELPASEPLCAIDGTGGFGLLLPRGFAELIEKGNPQDPLLLQVLPSAQEAVAQAGFSANPVGDLQAQPLPGLLHKYRGRALIMATGACAVHCRYCFRRHYPYAGHTASQQQREAILSHLKHDPEIREIIFSGGDPLMLPDARLADWFGRLAAIPHVRRLRLHTRLPVVLPERLTSALIETLSEAALPTILVLHINHPREITRHLIATLEQLRSARVTLLNQAVLLKGVNDSSETLALLSEALFEAGILPYYLHLLDRVAGAAHFEVPEARARRLYRRLLDRLPGYLVPKLVRETAGEGAKRPLSPG